MTAASPSPAAAPSIDAEIGRRVHQVMWDRHMTQTVFGELVGMDQSSVAKRLRGKLAWSASQVRSAAVALNTSVAYLFGETDNEKAPTANGEGLKLPGLDSNQEPIG